MDVEDRLDQQLRDMLGRRHGAAPPVAILKRQAGKDLRRRRTLGTLASVVLIAGSVTVGWALIGEEAPHEVTAGPSRGDAKPAERLSPRIIKEQILDALVATAPDMLSVIRREDDTTDRSQDPELGAQIEWDFADPALYDLESAPDDVEEWVRGDPGGGRRASASVRITPNFDRAGVSPPIVETSTTCGTCDFTGYQERENSYVQWYIIKDDVQINVISERPEVWSSMRPWLHRFASALNEISTLSEPAASDSEFPTGDITTLELEGVDPAAINANGSYLRFDADSGAVQATVGCQILAGTYSIAGDKLLIEGAGVRNLQPCEITEVSPADARSAAEAVFEILRSNPTWARQAGTLITLTGAGSELTGTIGLPK